MILPGRTCNVPVCPFLPRARASSSPSVSAIDTLRPPPMSPMEAVEQLRREDGDKTEPLQPLRALPGSIHVGIYIYIYKTWFMARSSYMCA